MKRLLCVVIGHRWVPVRAPGSVDSRDFYTRCLRCSRVNENPRTWPTRSGWGPDKRSP